MLTSQFSTHIVGHIAKPPRTFDLDSGNGAELRITVVRSYLDRFDVPTVREYTHKAVTYDTSMADKISNFGPGDFVEILADHVHVERAWKGRDKEWRSGSVVFRIESIRRLRARGDSTVPADQAPADDSQVLDGVRVSDERQPAEAGAA
ncbi:hypothetical protein [Actinomadura atramentaria]|uniref:hypothetical protein n=1 Tax=Actinomadura atramentaria TaxID=1990 RepID=UPI000381BAB6|nr:hypothetical protein [Actinomadura atramentaria]